MVVIVFFIVCCCLVVCRLGAGTYVACLISAAPTGLVGLPGSSESPYPLCKGGAYRGSGLPDASFASLCALPLCNPPSKGVGGLGRGD